MSGELVKIGASRGALAAWGILIKILVGQKLPIKILEQLLSDLLGDILQDLTKESSDVVTAYEDIPGTGVTMNESGEVLVQAEAIGLRVEAYLPDAWGKLFGKNGAPDMWALNRYEECPGGYAWHYEPWRTFSAFMRADFPGNLLPFPTSIRPYALAVYVNPGATLVVWQIRKKS